MDEATLVQCLEHRLVAMCKGGPGVAEILLESDDCTDCLDRNDQNDLHQDMNKGKKKGNFGQTLKEHVAHRKSVAAAAAAAAGGAAAPRRRLKDLPEGVLSHAQLKNLCPPNTFIWREWTHHAYGGHCPPFGEFSRSWNAHGPRGAGILVLRKLWQQHIALGRDSTCGVRGLMAEQALGEDADSPALILGS